MLINNKEHIWAEKYRPQRIEDMILPNDLKQKINTNIEQLGNMLLCSETPGTGKTSLVNAILRQSKLEALFINASLENGIETLRGKITSFASQCSFDGRIKVVVLDECDHLTDLAQGGFRGVLEEFSRNCRFILTCNYKNKIIEPIRNRLEIYDFDSINKSPEIVKEIFNRLKFILDTENVTYEDQQLVDIIRTFNPSIREMVMFMQKSTINNKLIIKEGDLLKADGFGYIIDLVKNKNFEEMVKECYKITSPDSFYTWVFKNINNFGTKKPQIILTVAKYQDMSSRVRDKNLNLCACLTEMVSLV